MPAKVAVVRARPETIVDDIRRVLELAELGADFAASDPVPVAARWGGDWLPGTGASPWQLDGALRALGRAPSTSTGPRPVLVVDPVAGARVDGKRGAAWNGVLDRNGARAADPRTWTTAPVHPSRPLPALAGALRNGPACPSPLQGRSLFLLPTPRWCRSWPLAGAVELLGSLFGPRRRRPTAPEAEIRAETVALARELFPRMGVLMDATVWAICRGRSVEPLARNLLLAGTDPVAVDAIASQLIDGGQRPAAWLDLCARRKLGEASIDRIEVVGATDLLHLDFGLPAATLKDPGAGPYADPLGRWAWRTFGRRRRLAAFAATAWGRLYEDYRTGRIAGEEP